MRRLLSLLLVLISLPAYAQVGIIANNTPAIGFTDGDCLGVTGTGSGTVSPKTCGGGSSGITIGSTTISGGTTTRVLYDLAGVVSESALLTLPTSQAVFTSGTVATSLPAISVTQTWNDGGGGTTVFTGILGNFVRTSGNATSLLIDLRLSGASRFSVNQAGSLVAGNTITSTGNMISGGTMTVASTSGYFFSTRSQIASSGDGNIRLADNGGTTFTSLTFGQNTASFPSLRISSADLQVALGNNSANAALIAGTINAVSSTTKPTGVPIGGIGMGKATDPASAPGAGFAKMLWVTGTAGGSCKLIAYAGTSTTPVTIIDNVGTGC